MRHLAERFAIVLVPLALVAGLACDGDAKPPAGADQPVYIESIEPSSATIGDEIVIRGHGFTGQNDIGFALPGNRNFKTGYQTRVVSSDGATIRFVLGDSLGACSVTQQPEGVPCELIALLLPVGETKVTVHNAIGTSNAVDFTRE